MIVHAPRFGQKIPLPKKNIQKSILKASLCFSTVHRLRVTLCSRFSCQLCYTAWANSHKQAECDTLFSVSLSASLSLSLSVRSSEEEANLSLSSRPALTPTYTHKKTHSTVQHTACHNILKKSKENTVMQKESKLRVTQLFRAVWKGFPKTIKDTKHTS